MRTRCLLLCLSALWLNPTEGWEPQRIGPGQPCGKWVSGVCDDNLICVPNNTTKEDDISGGVCSVHMPGCRPCSEVTCTPRDGGCIGSYVTDPCGCCPHCAHQIGDECAGPDWQNGYCDRDLTCALESGDTIAMPPETGICKDIPSKQVDRHADPLCPWKWGCNVHVGNCDCYYIQTCQNYFSYSTYDACHDIMMADMMSFGMIEEETEECVKFGCEVEESRCVCQERSCDSHVTVLTEEACEEQLKQMRCNNVSCPKVVIPVCPPDSSLIQPPTPDPCCPQQPGMCTCDITKCPTAPLACSFANTHLVAKGDGRPGTCCDRYKCKKVNWLTVLLNKLMARRDPGRI